MIAIYQDTEGDLNPDDFEPIALYDDERWLAGGDEWEPYYPAGTPEEVISSQLDGPDPVAVEVTEGSDELLAEIEKATETEYADAPMTSETERENDGHEGGDTDPPWASSDGEEGKTIGQRESTMLGVGDDVEIVDGDEDEEDPEDDDT